MFDELLAGSKPITLHIEAVTDPVAAGLLPEPWEMECSHPLCYAWWDPEVGCYVAAGRATEREAQRWY